MFSIYLDLKNDDSKIIFGGYDLQRFASSPDEDIKFFSFNKSEGYWNLHLNNVTIYKQEELEFNTPS